MYVSVRVCVHVRAAAASSSGGSSTWASTSTDGGGRGNPRVVPVNNPQAGVATLSLCSLAGWGPENPLVACHR